MDSSQNYFAYETVAERYARSRPYFQPLVVDRIRDYLRLEAPVSRALDVACGTGQSARALTKIAEQVIGTDLSPEMLAQATPHPQIEYRHCPAESIPLPDGYFDLVTVSMAFHWFDRARFLAEANRLLHPGGWLVIYNTYFAGFMLGNPQFRTWNNEQYLPRFPTPPRRNQPLTDSDATDYGFRFALRETYTNDITFTPDTLADYLMTQSNAVAVIEQGSETSESVYQRLHSELTAVLDGQEGVFPFNGYIWYLQKERSIRRENPLRAGD